MTSLVDHNSPSSVEAADDAAKLRSIVDRFRDPRFAVIDGGHFSDLPMMLRRERLFARSLFLSTADDAVQAAGPWLVSLDQGQGATDRVCALTAETPSAVFWSCAAGEMALWRHLRTINLARIPVWAARGEDPPPEEDAAPMQTVIFRHADPRVLGGLLPLLDVQQFSRFVGCASEVAFVAEDFGGVRRVVRSEDWPKPPSGLLELSSRQMCAFMERRQAAAHRRTTAYLRRLAPEVFAPLPLHKSDAFVKYCYDTGQGLGLRSEAAHRRWAFLMMASGGIIYDTPGATDFIRNGRRAPDEQLKRMYALLRQHLRGRPARDGEA